MSKTDVLEDRVTEEANTQSARAGAAALAAGALLRHKARAYADDLRDRISELGDRARDLRGQAMDFSGQASKRVRGFSDVAFDEVDRRRHTAAEQLEGLAKLLRPASTTRKRKMALVGGSGVALTVAVGAGVALGFVLSRELKKRREAKTATTPSVTAQPAQPAAPAALANSRDVGAAPDVVSDLSA